MGLDDIGELRVPCAEKETSTYAHRGCIYIYIHDIRRYDIIHVILYIYDILYIYI